MIGARFASAPRDLEEIARQLGSARSIALDVESDGMFAYKARVCTVQLAAGAEAIVVDALATKLDPLRALLGEAGPIKIVHDVAFDARILAESGVAVGNVHDTAIAARMLSRPATGLASLAMSELGVAIDKSLQHHDWRERPLLASHVDYLARDVIHLEALEAKLWSEVVARGIEREVIEETRYRIACAIAAAAEDAARARSIAYGFAKGFDKMKPAERAIFRRLWHAREEEAMRLDVPPSRLIATELLAVIARKAPRSARDLHALRLPRRAEDMTRSLLDAIARGIDDGAIPADEQAAIEPPRISRETIVRSRAREKALTAWRKATAKAREVDEQVILPGHCLKELAGSDAHDPESVTRVAGFGVCRAGYADAIAAALANAESSASTIATSERVESG